MQQLRLMAYITDQEFWTQRGGDVWWKSAWIRPVNKHHGIIQIDTSWEPCSQSWLQPLISCEALGQPGRLHLPWEFRPPGTWVWDLQSHWFPTELHASKLFSDSRTWKSSEENQTSLQLSKILKRRLDFRQVINSHWLQYDCTPRGISHATWYHAQL